jgi:hypothetical protein
MLLFAGDLIDTDFIRSRSPDDSGFATAIAHFETASGALEAQKSLHGKPNITKESLMIVEMQGGGLPGVFERRNTVDIVTSRMLSSSVSSGASSTKDSSARSRYESTFNSTDRISPMLTGAGAGAGVIPEFPAPENSAHIQNLFSPQSPLTNGVNGHSNTGKSVINDDLADEETGELLKDPVAFARNGHNPLARRRTSPQIPLSSSFARLSIHKTNVANNRVTSPTTSSVVSPRGASINGSTPSYSEPANQMSPATSNGSYPPHFSRPQYPPVNPADQNPPCNTLYVGNLPVDTSEDELKSIFSKQRGYKRLCFRTKQNGPMCFVEFEDIAYATKALHELYGLPLHNSVKGGIRLSFSKNPLGVRSGQAGAGFMPTNDIMTPQTMSPHYGPMHGGTNFSAISAPPPGLGPRAGLLAGGYRSPPNVGVETMFSNPFATNTYDFNNQLDTQNHHYSGGVQPNLSNSSYGQEIYASQHRPMDYTDWSFRR